jgi:hypothetical protein
MDVVLCCSEPCSQAEPGLCVRCGGRVRPNISFPNHLYTYLREGIKQDVSQMITARSHGGGLESYARAQRVAHRRLVLRQLVLRGQLVRHRRGGVLYKAESS